MVDNSHDQLFLTSQAHFTDKTHKTGPIEKRERPYPRPHEVYTED